MRGLSGRIGLGLALAIIWLSSTATAQTLPSVPAPPVFSSVDGNGVDRITGFLTLSDSQVSVGPRGSGGLERTFLGDGLRDNFAGTISISGDPITGDLVYTVSIGGASVKFTQTPPSGPIVPGVGAAGRSLTFNPSPNTYTYVDRDGSTAEFSFNISSQVVYQSNGGLITSLTKPNGEKLTYTYSDYSACGSNPNGCKRPQAVVSTLGYMIKYDYQGAKDATGNLDLAKVTAIDLAVEYCDPTLASCTLARVWPSMTFSGKASGTGTLTATDSISRTKTYVFTNNQITRITTPAGVVTNYTYNTDGTVHTVANSAGTWTYAYTLPAGYLTTVTDPLGHTSSLGSEAAYRQISSVTDGLGHTTSYAIGNNTGLVTRVTFAEGNYVDYTYDTRGNLTSATQVAKSGSGLANRVTTATYDTICSNPKTCNQPNSVVVGGAQTDFTYDASHGGILTITEPAGTNGIRPQTRYSYTALTAAYLTNATTVSAAPSSVYLRTGVSQCKTLASCAGSSDEVKTTLAYAAANNAAAPGANNLQLSSSTSGSGDGLLAATTSYTYNAFGDQRTVTGPLGAGQSVRYRLDNYRQVIGIVGVDPDASGSGRPSVAQQINYNADGQVTSSVTGTVASQSDADWAAFTASQTFTYGYDSLGRKVSEALSVSGAIQSLTQFSYDTANRLDCTAARMNPATFASPPSSACALATTGANGPDRISRNNYDVANRVTSVIQAYLTGGQFTEGATSFTNNGLVQTVADASGNLTTFEYDGFDRPSKTRYPMAASGGTSSSTDFTAATYNATTWDVTQSRRRDGQLVNYTYDARHRVTAKDAPSSTYAYDNFDRATSATQGGQTITTSYDGLGRVMSRAGPLGSVGYLYDLAGNRTRMTWPDGYFLTYVPDNTGAVLKIEENGATSGPGLLATYAYDTLGRRQTLTRGNGAVTNYTYDPASRLQTLEQTGTTQNQTLTFAYNAASQLLTRTSTNSAYAWPGLFNLDRGYTINGLNQVASTSTPATLAYDGRGNMTSDGATTYSYDIDNRLIGTSSGATLSYDPANRLYQTVSSGGSTTKFAYDGADIIGEYSASGTLVRRYVHGPGDDEPLVAYDASATKTWLLADQQGSIVASTTGSGTASLASYDDYGIPGSTNVTNVGRFQYTGQAWIPEVGVYYYKARMYSPILGRFLQTDPIGYEGGPNLYAYVGDDPTNLTDTRGLCPGCVDEIVVTGQRQPDQDFQSRQPDAYGGNVREQERNEGRLVSEVVVTAARRKKNPCGGGGGFLSRLAEGADNVSTVTGTGALVSGGLALVTSETGVGLLSFGGAAIGLEGVSKLASGVAIGAKLLDHNYVGAGISAASFGFNLRVAGALERAGARAVSSGQLGARHLGALKLGVSADGLINDQLLSCQAG